jgi:NAD(P)-dependent dehydrogenase (short-subunit alcohol dehydrogenase family)
MRNPVDHPDGRVVTLPLDVTDPAQIKAAADRIDVLDVIINNAGLGTYEDLADRTPCPPHSNPRGTPVWSRRSNAPTPDSCRQRS